MQTALPRLAVAALTAATLAAPTPAAAQEKPTSQVPTLGRPTKPDDPAPLLDFFAYFKGAWNVTWNYPESPLGPADVLTGVTTYTQKGPTTFVAATAAENSAGKFTIEEVFEYDREKHSITRTIKDSRGFAFTQKGTVNGDLGGQFTIRLDGEPFTVKGQSVRMNSIMRLLSPYNYRVQSNISVDGGTFTNFGNPWWRKEGASR
jgi:hypothetical protein